MSPSNPLYFLVCLIEGDEKHIIGKQCENEPDAQFRATDFHLSCSDNGFKIYSGYIRCNGGGPDLYSRHGERLALGMDATMFVNPEVLPMEAF